MTSFEVNLVNDGGKNVSLNVSGILTVDILPESPLTILTFALLKTSPRKLRLESVVFAIEEKAGFHLWWEGEDQKSLILPLESRGWFDFEKVGSLHSPEWATKLSVSSFKVDTIPKAFLLMLDLGKQ